MTAPQEPQEKPEKAGDTNSEPVNSKSLIPAAENSAGQIIEALNTLHRLTQVAIGNQGGRLEAERQLGVAAAALVSLSRNALVGGSDLSAAWLKLAQELSGLAGYGLVSTEARESEAEVILNDEDMVRRLSMTIPGHLRPESSREMAELDERLNRANLRKVCVASLEAGGEAIQHINLAASSFSRETWAVTNLGANVPIMALTGTVMEVKPSVLVLAIGQGQHLSETIRLIADLKRQLFGIRVLAVGPAMSQPGIVERLRADLYAAEPASAAQLADQFFNPLNRLGDRLKLSMDLPHEAPAPALEDKEDKTEE